MKDLLLRDSTADPSLPFDVPQGRPFRMTDGRYTLCREEPKGTKKDQKTIKIRLKINHLSGLLIIVKNIQISFVKLRVLRG